MIDKIRAIGPNYASNYDERDAGSCGSTHEKNTSTQFVDEEKCRQGTEHVDDTVNAGGKKRALREEKVIKSIQVINLHDTVRRTVLPLSPSWLNIVGA